MLLNHFFTFTELQTEGNIVKANIKLNPAHPIFKGHFPGQPIVPGVCMMQMVKEVVEAHINKKTRLVKASDLKFLSFIYPDQDKLLQLEVKINTEEEWVRIDARLLDDETILFKFKGILVPV